MERAGRDRLVPANSYELYELRKGTWALLMRPRPAIGSGARQCFGVRDSGGEGGRRRCEGGRRCGEDKGPGHFL